MGLTSNFDWWQLWTCHLWHWSAQHLLLNVLAALPPVLVLRRRALFVFLLGGPLLSLALITIGLDGEYRGASGLVVALWTFAGLTHRRVFLVAVAVKLFAEARGWWPSGNAGFESYAPAHYIGALVGTVFGAVGDRQSCLSGQAGLPVPHSARVLTIGLALLATPLAAETNLVVSSVLADPSMVAPVLRLYGSRGQATTYELGLSGWTIDGEWQKAINTKRSLVFSADATPLHAHNSNRMYVAGERVRELEYDNASYRVRGGMRFQLNPASTLDVRAVALYEVVDADRWSAPYAGVEATHTWSKIDARLPLIASFDGLEAAAHAELFAGKRAWSRLSLTETAGRTFGRVHLMQSAAVLHGSGLDVVNRFVVGGSWDSLRATAIYGLRYGELRLQRALIGSGGIDYRLAENWRVGIRGSWVDGDNVSTYGHAVHASTIWKTVGADIGIGKPKAGDAIFYATLIVPLYRR